MRTAQAYRPHILDMFEPQDHPHDAEYPGGPPKAPYDITGYTLAYQMGIGFDRILDGIEGRSRACPICCPRPRPHRGTGQGRLDRRPRNEQQFHPDQPSAQGGAKPAWIDAPVTANGHALRPGAIWIPASPRATPVIERAVRELGLVAIASDRAPEADSCR